MVQFRRYLTIIIGLAIIAGGMAANGFFASQKESPKQRPPQDKTPVVEVIEVKNSDISAPLEISGKLIAANRVNLFAEVSGVLLSTPQDFKAGSFYRKGELLLNLDDSEMRASITAQKSELLSALVAALPDLKLDHAGNSAAWETYINQFDINNPISKLPETKTDKEKYFVTSRKLYNAYYNVKSLEERLTKFKVTAPFDGVLTQAMIQTGTLVNPGQQLGEFIQKGVYELEAPLRPAELQFVKTGTEVELTSTELAGNWKGRVARINESIDPTTQTVKAYIHVISSELKQGMYLSGNLPTQAFENSFEVDRALLMDENQLAIIQDEKVIFKSVNVHLVNANSSIVSGLEDGTSLMASPSAKLKNGQQVKVQR